MRNRSFTLYIVLGAILLILLNLPDRLTLSIKASVRDGIAPLQSAITGLAHDVREVFRSIRGLGGLAVENRKLTGELARLNREADVLRALERENIDLRDQLGFMKRASRQLIACEVIGRDISGWWQTIRLGKGASDGVLPNMAVITMDGLVGKTVAVSARTADVLLISDPACRISARVARAGAFGIISGAGVGARGQVVCRMSFIDKTKPILPGDEVVTSGLGGVFPKGLPIGYADKIEKDKADLYLTADVVPRANFGALDYVFVVVEPGDAGSGYVRSPDSTETESE